MRALTLVAPMGYALVVDHPRAKRLENRIGPLPVSMLGISTVVAIHSGKKWSEAYADTILRILGRDHDLTPAANQGGMIIGVMRLTGRQFTDEDRPIAGPQYGDPSVPSIDPWYGGPYAYEVADALALPHPVLCRGMQGWWPLPESVEHAINHQMAGLRPLR